MAIVLSFTQTRSSAPSVTTFPMSQVLSRTICPCLLHNHSFAHPLPVRITSARIHANTAPNLPLPLLPRSQTTPPHHPLSPWSFLKPARPSPTLFRFTPPLHSNSAMARPIPSSPPSRLCSLSNRRNLRLRGGWSAGRYCTGTISLAMARSLAWRKTRVDGAIVPPARVRSHLTARL